MYSVYHRNVDGAGFCAEFDTYEAAKQDAEERQARSDSKPWPLPNGSYVFNPYLYEYTVFGSFGRVMYRTSSRAPRGEFARLEDVA